MQQGWTDMIDMLVGRFIETNMLERKATAKHSCSATLSPSVVSSNDAPVHEPPLTVEMFNPMN